ncbi:MAG: LytTR family DNA-binding domain-containing protein [Oscillospiraceae bacterium]|nr:LytTR family DNA-binding domain-containing protein [Oscillospiraceae bacterium]
MSCRFAICDDDQDYARYLEGLAARWAARAGTRLEVERFPSAQAFLFRYEERQDFDVLLLDIEMGGMDGVELARTVRRENDDVQIVFVTGYADYIAQGYEVSALHYLTKPVDEQKLFQVLTRAVGRLRRNEKALTLTLPGQTVRLPLSQVRYLEVLHNYVTVHAGLDYTVKRPLSELEKELDGRFFRVGRSCILNLSFIRRASRTQAELTTGEHIPLPRGQYDKLNRAIIDRI